MKKWLLTGLLLAVAAVGVYDLKLKTTPCGKPLRYSLGTVDPRFGISEQGLLAELAGAEQVWEKPMGRELFQYDPKATFKVNLIFDDRQKRTNEERELRSKIDSNGESYDGMVKEYNALYDDLQKQQAAYEAQQNAFNAQLSGYNQEVDYWNKRKDIAQSDYDRINLRKRQLQTAQADLERARKAVNAQAAEVNALADRINALGRKLNLDVDFYNGKFGKTKEFDQGVYTGDAIDIYQYSSESDLKIVLAHELGHALKLDHVGTPEAIMYYLMQKQDLENIHATSADVEALKAVCNIK